MPDDLKDFLLLSEVRAIYRRVVTLERRVAFLSARYGIEPSANGRVRRDPRRWRGTTLVGRTFQDCPVGYLEFLLGDLLDFAKETERFGSPKRSLLALERANLIREWIFFKKAQTSAT